MEQLKLKATERKLLGKKVKVLRNNNQLPAVLYGRKFQTVPLTLDRKEFLKIAATAGEATLIDIEIADQKTGEPIKALIRDIQRDPVKDDFIHVDLYKVDMQEKIETEIPLEFSGTAPAVEELEGNLITPKTSIKVKCLPDKLVSQIEVDTGVLKTFEDLIHVKDLNIPEGIEVLDESEDVVAQVTPPRSEEELEALEKEAKTAAETEKEQIEGIEATAEAEKSAKETEEETEKEPVEKDAQDNEKPKG